ncbi:P-loop containing nucleoside triphosphate hydrolase protein [Stachybotrys elegans]|uniref:P-loop containing nucleoside triphosphate hydrolase protein n=1 Tax=Stachybotrys elegans TaxID=80388 RepID=A0A8K0WKM5_9HYPO|nr:P-loop containing nucleoside triphosphate hydrolase protein [Stachybotrys elegans]
MSDYNVTECNDGFFGPSVWADERCRGAFDFTVAFEESILATVPAALFLLLACPRLVHLFRTGNKAKPKATYSLKIVAIVALVVSSRHTNTRFSAAAAVLNLVAALFITALAHAEHVKSIRPSFLLTTYLFTTVLFDAARLRTEWLMSVNKAYAAVLSTSVALKIILLGLETVEKRSILTTDHIPSRESTSGPLNRGFFVWLNPLLLTGWSTVLQNNQLPPIHERVSSANLAARFSQQWDKAMQSSKRPSLFLAVIRALKWDLLGIAAPRFLAVGLSISRPFLTTQAMRFLTLPESSPNNGYGLIGAFALVFLSTAVVIAWYEHLTFRAGSQVRGGMITLIYRKMLRMPSSELNESSAVALMGNDVETLVELIKSLLVESWANAITVIITTWLLADQLGAVCVAPIILGITADDGIVSLLLSGAIGNTMYPRQTAYLQATQSRINFTSEVLRSIKSVKMLGFTERFSTLIEQRRAEEIRVGKRYRQLSVAINALVNGNIALAEVVTFGAFAIVSHLRGAPSFSVTQAITTLSILNVMLAPLCDLLASITSSFQVFGCFKRIEDFLLQEEQTDHRAFGQRHGQKPHEAQAAKVQASIELQGIPQKGCDEPHISMVDASFRWGGADVLRNIGISLSPSQSGSFTMIIGPIGCGKSTLLKGILGETSSATGNVSVANADIAYCSQAPWVMNATLKENIVAQSSEHDSAWFETVINACDLSTDFSRFPSGSMTVVGDNGLKLSGGQRQRLAIARAIYSRKPIAIFDDVFSGLDKATEQVVFTRVFGKTGLLRKTNTLTILATHSVHFLPESDHIVVLDKSGQITEQGHYAELSSSGGYVNGLDISESQHPKAVDEATSESEFEESKEDESEVQAAVDEIEVATDRSIFKYYLSSIGGLSLAIMILYNIGQAFFATFRHVWLAWWGEGYHRSSDDVGYWLGTYTSFAVLDVVFLTISVGHLFFMAGPTSGNVLHARMLNAAMGAPMSFLSNSDTGSLVNRFSQDLRLVDMVLPRSLAIFLLDVFGCLGVVALAAAAVPWFAIAMPFIAIVLGMVQRFYVRTSKQLRLLEIEHKAPLYSHFFESITGIVTIRSFGWTPQYSELNQKLLDKAQRPSYLLNAVQRWLALVLDLVVATLTVMLVAFAVTLRSQISPALLGVALVNMMRVGDNMKGIVVEWSTLETSLGAVTRIRDFARDTPSEVHPDENHGPEPSWPAAGKLEMKHVNVQYDENSGPVLQDVSLEVNPGEKLGLCGRSGSGKSSLIQAILRMADTLEGQILVDGVDISTVPRSLVRQRLSCLTQDPFLFTNTVRFNADPLNEHGDEEIVRALTRVGLWAVIMGKVEPGTEPLDAKMEESFLSHGQKQLFCLARALLRKSPFLILDEPTSSVDLLTDAQMQEIIRSEFTDRTVIMIAHRLDTILDFDRIAVLDHGRVVEYGSPSELMAMEDGALSTLYRAQKNRTKKRAHSGVP